MFEHRSERLLSPWRFLLRMLRSTGLSGAIVAGSLAIGSVGYHVTERLPWLDALLNATMILTCMGPITPPQTTGGKVFAIFYALFSGLIFVVAAGVLVAPMVHRVLHACHLEIKAQEHPSTPARPG